MKMQVDLNQSTLNKLKDFLRPFARELSKAPDSRLEITRRDFFAGCALIGGLASYQNPTEYRPDRVAKVVFDIADKMETERNKSNGKEKEQSKTETENEGG